MSNSDVHHINDKKIKYHWNLELLNKKFEITVQNRNIQQVVQNIVTRKHTHSVKCAKNSK